MFSTGKPIAQGEVLIWMKKYAPQEVLNQIGDNVTPLTLEYDQMIIGHSETGHHHVLEPVDKQVPISKAARALITSATDMWMDLKLFEPCALIHQRHNDTHTGFILPAGEYIRAIREEQTPTGWRRVID
jgi:hypothetical protein